MLLKKIAVILIYGMLFAAFGFFYLRPKTSVLKLHDGILSYRTLSLSNLNSTSNSMKRESIAAKKVNFDSSAKSNTDVIDPVKLGPVLKSGVIEDDAESTRKYYLHDEKESEDQFWSAVRIGRESEIENSNGNVRKILGIDAKSKTRPLRRKNTGVRPKIRNLLQNHRSKKKSPRRDRRRSIMRKVNVRARRKMRYRPYHGPHGANSHSLIGVSSIGKKNKKGKDRERHIDLFGSILKKSPAAARNALSVKFHRRMTTRPASDLANKKAYLHYELSGKWPETCKCKLAKGLDRGICYYYVDKFLRSCKSELCAKNFICVVGGERTGTTCIRKKRTRRVVSDGEGTCRTVIVDEFTYIPYSR